MENEIEIKSDIQIHLYGSLQNMEKKHDEFTIRTGLESEAHWSIL